MVIVPNTLHSLYLAFRHAFRKLNVCEIGKHANWNMYNFFIVISCSKERHKFNKHLENNYQPFKKKIEKVSNKIVKLLAKYVCLKMPLNWSIKLCSIRYFISVPTKIRSFWQLHSNTSWTEKNFLFLYFMGFRNLEDEILGICAIIWSSAKVHQAFGCWILVYFLENIYFISYFRRIARRSLLIFLVKSNQLFIMDVWLFPNSRNNRKMWLN